MIVKINNPVKVIRQLIWIILIIVIRKVTQEIDNSLLVLSWVSIASLFISFYDFRKNLISIPFIAELLLYIYNCGQLWLIGLGIRMKYTSYLISNFESFTISVAVFYFLIIVNSLHLFILMFCKTKADSSKNIEVTEINRGFQIKDRALEISTQIGFFVIASLLLYSDYHQIVAALSGGYSTSFYLLRDVSIFNLAMSVYPLIIFLMILSNDSTLRGVGYFHAIVRSLIMLLLVGNRGQFIVLLCVILVLWYKSNNRKENKSRITLVSLTGVILVIVATYVANIRDIIVEKPNLLEFLINENIFVNLFQELGGTLNNLILVQMNSPSNLPWGVGKSYLAALLLFVPKGSSLFPAIARYSDLGSILNTYFVKGFGLGGSAIAELYYNFHWFSLALLPLYALGLKKLEEALMSNSANTLKKGIFAYLTYAVFMHMRGNFSDFALYARYLMYFLLLYWFIKSFRRAK